ncbi:hypothetical protein PI126_g15218 [Phytophthora idaei]|nr:hypothetical protein PI126_g15218 [Phytophthora idaei]
MDMRSKAYPALPDGRGLRLVIPRVGDLRFRPQIPAAFTQRLYIHADPRRRFWYARFQLRRKFIVMSTQGDLYAKTSVATFTMADLPKQNVLSMPRVARRDLVKVLDLVQCSRSEGQQWELVFTRWRNGMETWLPVEVVQLYASNLLQEFYVNSINSWAFHARLQQGNLSAFRTEVELWLFHPEFQEFYKRLRQKRAGGSTASHPQQQAGNVSDRPMSKKRRRLRQPDSNGGESNSVEVDLTQLSDDEEETDNSVEVLTDHAVTTPVEPLEGDGNESGGGKVISELVEENGDADHDDDMDFEPSILIGEIRTLAMHAARNGLVKGLCYLLDVRKVNLFETDLQSRNSLHHAALGGEDAALVGMGDLDSNFPIHYACQAINNHTVEICQLILAAQSSMLQEKSSEGFYPLMILCKAAGTATAMRNRAVNASEVCRSAKDIIALMLDIDVFGDCLNQTAPNGWRPLHFAAASGNHELVTHLCNLGMCDVQYAAKESDQTALHIAAHNNDPLCVRALLLEGLNVVAKDTDGWIPMLYAENAACVQEFMHYKLTKQLSRLHRMLGKFQQRELVHRWQRCVARDPICFDILNDWCQSDTERIERMEGLLLSNPFLLRLDNKIDYVWRYIIQSIKISPGQCSIGVENGKSGPEKQPGQKKLAFSFSRERGCFWKQFVGMGMRLEPEDFRLPMIFSIERGNTNSQGAENREGNLKLVLIRLAAGLLKEVPGLLVRGSKIALENTPLSSGKEELAALLVGFFVLGELVAHFVLFAVPSSGILDFTASFLRCVGCKGKYRLARDKRWENAGCSFAAGFEAVLPATLELFHADELRLLFNGPETSLNALQIDWNTAVDWNMCGQEIMGDMKTWLPRLMNELVEEEQQLLLLFMTGTFQLVNERFFRSEGSSGRITVESFSETDSVLDHDTMYPTMEDKPDILRLPSYSCYEAFKKGMLGVIRHTDQAFLPE